MMCRFSKTVFSSLRRCVLLATALQFCAVNNVHAMPAAMGMGMGTPAQCDAALGITPTQSLQFGIIAAPLAGTVIVDTAGTRTFGGGVVLVSGGTVSAASFTMTTLPTNCANRRLVTVVVTSPASLAGAGPAMTLDTFVTVPVANDRFTEPMTLLVGGTLHVNALQPAGTYNGNIFVTVTFQ